MRDGSTCHLCLVGALAPIPGFEPLPRVTSDCKPWPAGGHLLLCTRCGTVQKNTDEVWLDEIRRIYADYTIYYQSSGQEQPVCVEESGGLQSRSSLLLGRLQKVVRLPDRGRALDIGCGNGSYLRSFSALHPGWTMVGTEFDAKYQREVEDIPGVEKVHTGPVADLEGTFTVASLIHVMEHIPWPGEILDVVHEKLVPDGYLILDLPDFQLNPFDFVVADHCSHFTEESVQGLLERHGFRAEILTTSWIRKERVVVARKGPRGEGLRPFVPEEEIRKTHASIRFLQGLIDQARALRARAPLGLFGTSIAGTWLAGALGDEFDFFVEEDTARIGRLHRGKPILAPQDAPSGSEVLIALSNEIAPLLHARYAEAHPAVGWHVPA